PLCLSPFFSPVPPTLLIYSLSLHDALPILKRLTVLLLILSGAVICGHQSYAAGGPIAISEVQRDTPVQFSEVKAILSKNCLACQDRKSTRLNSSHVKISYAVFCLKKKKNRK